jgi:DNA-binding transcriptional ArsR family regulator
MVKRSGELSAVYAALADPTRRRMLEDLRQGPRTVSELRQPSNLTLAAVGKHVATLEAAGLISSAKRGRVRSCRLVAGALSDAQAWIEEQNRFWSARLDALSAHLEEES